MTKTKILFATIATLLFSACSKSPNDVIESAYNSLTNCDYASITDYINIGNHNSLSSEECDVFDSIMKFQYDSINIISFAIDSCNIDEEKGVASFIVCTKYSNGDSITESGVMHRNNSGKWLIDVISADSTQASAYDHNPQYKFIPRARFGIYRILANRGDANAQYELCKYYKDSVYVEPNHNEVYKLAEASAKQGYTKGEWLLGQCYRWGYGVEQDKTKAEEWYKKAADKNDTKAIYDLGCLYLNFKNDEQQNPQKALEIFLKGAELGDTLGLFGTGVCYELMDNNKSAFEYYKKAADKGHVISLYYLGIFYSHGRGLKKDKEKAAEIFLKAAALGIADAMSDYGYYLKEKNDAQGSWEWYLKAAEHGSSLAMWNVATRYKYGKAPVKRNIEEHDNWMKKYSKAYAIEQEQNILNGFK